MQLDVAATSLEGVFDTVLAQMVASGKLSEASIPSATKLLAGARNPNMPRVPGRASVISSSVLQSDGSGTVQQNKDWFHMLKPEKGEEALDLIVAHVEFVSEAVMSFVRLATPIDSGLEGHAPVRYLFLLLGPEADAQRSMQLAHALGGLMLDESFVRHVKMSAKPEDFLAALDDHLEHVAILPHVHVPHFDDDEEEKDDSTVAAAATSFKVAKDATAAVTSTVAPPATSTVAPASTSSAPLGADEGSRAPEAISESTSKQNSKKDVTSPSKQNSRKDVASNSSKRETSKRGSKERTLSGRLSLSRTTTAADALGARDIEDESDEDELVLGTLEDKLRSGKGMKLRESVKVRDSVKPQRPASVKLPEKVNLRESVKRRLGVRPNSMKLGKEAPNLDSSFHAGLRNSIARRISNIGRGSNAGLFTPAPPAPSTS